MFEATLHRGLLTMALNAFMESKNLWLKLNGAFAAHFFLLRPVASLFRASASVPCLPSSESSDYQYIFSHGRQANPEIQTATGSHFDTHDLTDGSLTDGCCISMW